LRREAFVARRISSDDMRSVLPDIHRASPEHTRLLSLALYAIASGDRILLIDTGYHAADCQVALSDLVESLGYRWDQTDVFLTHLHHDHSGLAAWCERQGATIHMGTGRREASLIDLATVGGISAAGVDLADLAERQRRADISEGRRTGLSANGDFEPPRNVVELVPGSVIDAGEYRFETLPLPGHAREQTGLIDREKGILFCGDHIIQGIAPVITTTRTDEHRLATYVRALETVRDLDLQYLFPGHGDPIARHEGETAIADAIDWIASKFARRCVRAARLVCRADRPLTVFDVVALTTRQTAEEYFTGDLRKALLGIANMLTCLDFMHERGFLGRQIKEDVAYYNAGERGLDSTMPAEVLFRE
jgi:glyoxylase-like metal-dependent hydrolase (beta-lactamase superfamily II)